MRRLDVPTVRVCVFVVVSMKIDAQTAPFTIDCEEAGDGNEVSGD